MQFLLDLRSWAPFRRSARRIGNIAVCHRSVFHTNASGHDEGGTCATNAGTRPRNPDTQSRRGRICVAGTSRTVAMATTGIVCSALELLNCLIHAHLEVSLIR